MIYSKHISTDADLTASLIKRTPFRITRGLVYKVEFYFPCGSAGLMGVAVFDGSYSVWPSNIGEFITGDDLLISFDDLYLKDQPPYQFNIYTYNHDDTHNHALDVRIGLVSKEAYQARFLPNKSWEYFAGMLSELEQQRSLQELAQREKILETPFEWLEKE